MKEYSANEVAKMLNVSNTTVLGWIYKGLVDARAQPKMMRTYYYIPENEVERLKEIFKIK
jgi:predicted site-specific integrase-resolvase